MEIKKGVFFDNRTKNYLLPAVKVELGNVFKQKYETQIFKLAVGVYDKLLDGTNILKGRNAFFILVDKTVLPQEFKKFKDWIKYKDFYITDYQYENDKHMFVIEIPKCLDSSFNSFKIGAYSKMYTDEQLEKYFILENKKEPYKTLIKHPSIRKKFIERVVEKFQVEVRESDFLDAEYDFPPSINPEKEVFNYE